jgi:hypothetical protein
MGTAISAHLQLHLRQLTDLLEAALRRGEALGRTAHLHG